MRPRTRSRSSLRPISIHAPTWGATLSDRCRRLHYSISIHAPTWGATHCTATPEGRWVTFQSTHPRGVRRASNPATITIFDFNPRTHVGCDYYCICKYSKKFYFNPRTHVGCDLTFDANILTCYISIHAPTWGATNMLSANIAIKLFQSTHPRGVRRPTRRG